MSFSVVIVLHDSAPDLERLLRSIDEHLVPQAPQVICVDSGSTDAGAGVAVAQRHGADVVVLDGNPGFGAASNAGLRLARHSVTVLLNPDIVVLDPVSLPALAGLAAAQDALHVPRLLNGDGTIQDSAHPRPGSAGHALLALTHPPRLPSALRVAAQPWRAGDDRRVGWAIAACVAARTATLRELGPFDPETFLFYEDLDLCLRAAAADRPTILHPDLVLRHAGQHSTGPAFAGEPFDVLARRRRAVVRANLGTSGARRDDLLQALTFGTRVLATRLTRRAPGPARDRLRALRRALRDG